MRAEVVAEFISSFGLAFEVGVGYYWDVAEILNGMGKLLGVCDIRDLREEAERRGIRFLRCNIENPDNNLVNFCRNADVVYAIRLPPEMWKYLLDFAKICGCVCVIKPLYGDYLWDCLENRLVNYKGETFYVF